MSGLLTVFRLTVYSVLLVQPMWDIRTTPSNDPPIAVAGADQSVRAGDVVQLDGSASFDDNTASEALLFEWDFVQVPVGSAAVLLDTYSATPQLITDVAGTYVIVLVVTDEEGLSSEPDFVLVSSDNLAPTAQIEVDSTLVVAGETVILDGSSSFDPEDDPLSYDWSLVSAPDGSEAVLNAIDPANPAVALLTTDVAGTYSISLVVSDPLARTPVTA